MNINMKSDKDKDKIHNKLYICSIYVYKFHVLFKNVKE